MLENNTQSDSVNTTISTASSAPQTSKINLNKLKSKAVSGNVVYIMSDEDLIETAKQYKHDKLHG